MKFERTLGILMPISSLPGKYGIGTLGRSAYEFVSFLEDAGVTYWQILPPGPTGYGDSPYQSFSAFAGNPYFIDPEFLYARGVLSEQTLASLPEYPEGRVDYGRIYQDRNAFFDVLQEEFFENPPADFSLFCKENSFWLEDYALFCAIKEGNGGIPLSEFPLPLRQREPSALREAAERYASRVLRHKMLQYLFYSQWFALKRYVNDRGIRLIGDLPIYVSADSADVFSHAEVFLLDEEGAPAVVAGCPPDGFSPDGQLWGNPVYDWERLKADDYGWWCRRLAFSLRLCDCLRMDHFRGFEAFYTVAAGEETAQNGTWQKGPGMELFDALRAHLGDLPLIAEDLGFLTEQVRALLAQSGFPGMKVLQFAFDDEESEYLPHCYEKNTVVYTGTHDNDTLVGWVENASEEAILFACRYLNTGREQLPAAMVRAALASVSDLCVLTAQDLLMLGSEARMNTPATDRGNWCWRAMPGAFSPAIAAALRAEAQLYGRIKK